MNLTELNMVLSDAMKEAGAEPMTLWVIRHESGKYISLDWSFVDLNRARTFTAARHAVSSLKNKRSRNRNLYWQATIDECSVEKIHVYRLPSGEVDHG